MEEKEIHRADQVESKQSSCDECQLEESGRAGESILTILNKGSTISHGETLPIPVISCGLRAHNAFSFRKQRVQGIFLELTLPAQRDW
jgi:hypothetical protein